MAYSLKDKIFGYFSVYDNRTDINKNASGAGTLQRYNEACADEFDTEIMPFIENIQENLHIPLTLLLKFFPYAEQQLGINFNIGSTEVDRRRLIRFYYTWVQRKGTITLITYLFELLGYTVTITEEFETYGFDSPTTFDSNKRTFDSGCGTCGTVTFALVGGGTGGQQEINMIYSIIYWNLPIHALLTSVTLNGTPINPT